MHFAVLNIVQNFTYDHTRQVVLKRCLHYHTCTPYGVHVRRTCAKNVYTVAHVRRACATNRYTSQMHDVHVRRTCMIV